MAVAFPRIGELIAYDAMPLPLRVYLLTRDRGDLFGGYCPVRRTIELYRLETPGQNGAAEFLGYLSPEPVVMKERKS